MNIERSTAAVGLCVSLACLAINLALAVINFSYNGTPGVFVGCLAAAIAAWALVMSAVWLRRMWR